MADTEKIAFDAEGYPVNLPAAALDAYEWLVQLRAGNLSLRRGLQAQGEALERLDRCIAALDGFLASARPAPEGE